MTTESKKKSSYNHNFFLHPKISETLNDDYILPKELTKIVCDYSDTPPSPLTEEHFTKLRTDFNDAADNNQPYTLDLRNLDLRRYHIRITYADPPTPLCGDADSTFIHDPQSKHIYIHRAVNYNFIQVFSGINFAGFDFSGSDLEDFRLEYHRLMDPLVALNFTACNLTNSRIELCGFLWLEANFSNANLENCTIQGMEALVDTRFKDAEIAKLTLKWQDPLPLVINTDIAPIKKTWNERLDYSYYESKEDFFAKDRYGNLAAIAGPIIIMFGAILTGITETSKPTSYLASRLAGLENLHLGTTIGSLLCMLGCMIAISYGIKYFKEQFKHICSYDPPVTQNVTI